MAKYELTKSVEAVKLNPRTGASLGQHAITLPYGAIIDNVEEVGDYYKFSYLSERYQMKVAAAQGALSPLGGGSERPPVTEMGSGSTTAAAAPVEAGPPKPLLSFETLRSRGLSLSRAKVPGGWLVVNGSGVAFVPDSEHAWDGGSVE
jgi:hypothetical protein